MLSGMGVTTSCNYNDSTGTSSNFNELTGLFTYSSNNKDNSQFNQGVTVIITITAIAGTTGDVLNISTNALVFSCMVEPSAIVWKIPISYSIEYIVKNYDPIWVASKPIVTISPLTFNPLT